MNSRKIRWQAKWIWLAELAETPNTYVFFRKQFHCNPSAKAQALLHLTAGHFYRAYINGQFIGRGPDRCYFRSKIYHTYDISRLLRKGENIIAVQVHFLGRSDLSIMERHAAGPAGLIAQLELNGKIIAKTDNSWKAALNPAYSIHTTPPMFHREWREDFYPAREPKRWQALAFDDSSWKTAVVIAPAEGGPWTKLIPKETAEMTSELIAPITLYIEKPQYNRGEEPEYDGTTFYNAILNKPHAWPGPTRVWNHSQKKHSLLFDMGRTMAGFPRLVISKCNGGKIEILYGDTLSLTHWDTINLGKEPLTWTPFTTRGGRYFRLDISGAGEGVNIDSVRWVRTNYPVQKRGRFSSSDKTLNAIWDMCERSAETCGMEHFVDCVGREQVLWMMDFRFQAPQHCYYFGDTALARKCFRQFAALQLKNGHILGYGPSTRPMEELLPPRNRGKKLTNDWFGFNFYYILAVWEYYRYTGDKNFLKEFYPVCKRCLEYHRAHEKNGFARIGSISGTYFVDWGYKGYVNDQKVVYSFTQALYYGAQEAFRNICSETGNKAEASKTAARARQLRRKFFKTFVDLKTNKIADCVIGSRRLMRRAPHPYFAAALFLDDIPPKALKAWLDAITDRRLHASCSGFGNTLAAEALTRHGRYADAIQLISNYWGAMVAAGLPQTPEHFDVREPYRWSPGVSACHSYASMAGVLLQQIILGGRVEGKRITISPWFGKLPSARGVVPTVAGDVQIAWRRRGKEIDLQVKAPKAVQVIFKPVNDRERVNYRLLRQ
jgi:hypothetical protein